MWLPDLLTTAERRLAVLLFLLSAAGLAVRAGRGLSPEVAAWLDESPGAAAESPAAAAGAGESAPTPETPGRPSEPGASPRKVDPGTATREELMALPGIGPALAGRILADREANGPYRRARDLLRVSGIGPATLRRIEPYLDLP